MHELYRIMDSLFFLDTGRASQLGTLISKNIAFFLLGRVDIKRYSFESDLRLGQLVAHYFHVSMLIPLLRVYGIEICLHFCLFRYLHL